MPGGFCTPRRTKFPHFLFGFEPANVRKRTRIRLSIAILSKISPRILAR
jgi:hypothetical protein